MLFYDEFLKKLDEEKFQIDEIEKFSPEIKKVVVGLGVSLPLIIIAMAQLYMAKVDGNMVRVAFAIAFIFMGVKQLKTTFSYKIQTHKYFIVLGIIVTQLFEIAINFEHKYF